MHNEGNLHNLLTCLSHKPIIYASRQYDNIIAGSKEQTQRSIHVKDIMHEQ